MKWLALFTTLSTCLACASQGPAAQGPTGPAERWGRSHDFDDSSNEVDGFDLNKDGHPDYIKVSKDGVLVREEWDLNQDRQPEQWRYYDDSGEVEEEEWDADYDGNPDIIAYYEAGKLVRREESNNFIGRMTTRRTYEAGALTLVEQDTDDNGRFDTWEFYEAGKLVKVGKDTNGDGEQDSTEEPSSTMKALARGAGGEEAKEPSDNEAEKTEDDPGKSPPAKDAKGDEKSASSESDQPAEPEPSTPAP